MPKVYARRCPTARPAEKQTARSALEWGMQQTGTELSSLPRFPVEFIDIPAIQRDTEIRPNKTADDYWEKPFHGHGRNLPKLTSITRFWASGARWSCAGIVGSLAGPKNGGTYGAIWNSHSCHSRRTLPMDGIHDEGNQDCRDKYETDRKSTINRPPVSLNRCNRDQWETRPITYSLFTGWKATIRCQRTSSFRPDGGCGTGF